MVSCVYKGLGALVSASYSLPSGDAGDGRTVFHTVYSTLHIAVCSGTDRDIHPDNSALFQPYSYHAFLGTCVPFIICNRVLTVELQSYSALSLCEVVDWGKCGTMIE